MKLALIFDPECPKLTAEAYSQTYRDMMMALPHRYASTQMISSGCSARDIEADHIVFFDPHSSHHIVIDGIEKHKALKFEYFNDPHQVEQKGKYANGLPFHKLGPEQRCRRANRRGVKYAICPYEAGFHRYLAPYFEGELLWFPVSPKDRMQAARPLEAREAKIVGNGHVWSGEPGFRPYAFRRWAFAQPEVSYVPHAICDGTPKGDAYQRFLSRFVGALALCDTYVVPKYLEIPLAGCLCLAQYHYEYEKMGFHDGHQCLYVTRKNLRGVLREVIANPDDYQSIAANGRELARRWSPESFAEAIHGKDD